MVDASNDMALEQTISAVRGFNRFYTQKIGVLDEHLMKSPFSLTEARLLFELAHRNKPAAADLARDLGLDRGYLSRTLASFDNRGLIAREASPADGRQSLLSLTGAGRAALAELDHGARDDVARLLRALSDDDRRRLTGAMDAIEAVLGGGDDADRSYVLRAHQPGDMGWIVHRQALFYAREFGWDETFEALIAEIVAKFVRDFDPARERCWIAERSGAIVGSIFGVRESDSVAVDERHACRDPGDLSGRRLPPDRPKPPPCLRQRPG
jgi:DNA-binding MarR family transcriptional regulator